MGELPPTGGAAFIAAAGGVAHTRGGGGVIWPVDIPEGEGALFGTKGRALGQSASLCDTKWGRRGTLNPPASPIQFVGNTNSNPNPFDSAESSLINQSSELRLRKKAGHRDAATPCRQAPTFGDIPNTSCGSFDLPACLTLLSRVAIYSPLTLLFRWQEKEWHPGDSS